MANKIELINILEELVNTIATIDYQYIVLEIKNKLKNYQNSLDIEKKKIFKPGYIELISNTEVNSKLNLYEPGICDIFELENLIYRKKIKEICLHFKSDKLSEVKGIITCTEYCIKNNK